MPKKYPPRPLTEPAIQMIAERFRALGEPTRLKLLIALQSGEKNVGELVRSTRATQANVSRHLQTLAEAGLVLRRKEGVTVFYRVSDDAVFDLCQLVCGSVRKTLAQQAKAASLFPA